MKFHDGTQEPMERAKGRKGMEHQLNSEEEAIARAQNGDATAFEYLYKSHSKHVFSVCLRMLGNTAEAEDLTQQVFLRLFRKIATFRGESSLSTWLHRVTVNTVLMHMRRKKVSELLVDDFDGEGKDSLHQGQSVRPDASTRSAIEAMNLRRAIRRLPAAASAFSCCTTCWDTGTRKFPKWSDVRSADPSPSCTGPENACASCWMKALPAGR